MKPTTKTIITLTIILTLLTTPQPTIPQNNQTIYTPIITTQTYIDKGYIIAPHMYKWRFDGQDDYIEITDSPELRFGYNDFTLEFLVYPIKNTSVDFFRNNLPVNTGYLWTGIDSRGKYKLTTRSSDTNELFSIISTTTATAKYTHVVFKRNGTLWSIYIDGTLDNQATDTRSGREETYAGWFIGKMEFQDWFNGYIGFVRIYNRALDNDEIFTNYNDHVVNASGLVLFLDPTFFDGTHYVDLSGHGNHGTPYGGVKRIEDENKWLWIVVNGANDDYVHLRWFPRGWVVRFKNPDTGVVVKEVFIASNDEVVDLSPGEYVVEAGYYVFLSPVSLFAYTDKASVQVGEPVYIYFVPRNSTGFVHGLNVTASVVKPDSTVVNLSMAEDTYNGVYYCLFNDTDLIGTYDVRIYTEINGVSAEARTRFETGDLERLLSMLGVETPSLSSHAVFDGVTASVLGIIGLCSLYYFRKKKMYTYLLLVGVAVLVFSIVVMSARAVVPVGYTFIRAGNDTLIEYKYDENPFAILYYAPIGIGSANIIVYVVEAINRSRRALGKTVTWGRRYRWG